MTLTVLLVEDDRELRTTLREALSVENYRVLTAASAADARAQLAHLAGDVDLVLLDLGLPDEDGESLLAALRRDRRTPVIVISARHSDEPKIRLLDAGADDYLVKPFSLAELLARMRVALRHRGAVVAPALTRYEHAGLRDRHSRASGDSRRQADPPDADRVQAAGAPRAQRRAGGDASPVARRRLGTRVHGAHALPAPLHGAAARPSWKTNRPTLSALLTEPGMGYRLAELPPDGTVPYVFLMRARRTLAAITVTAKPAMSTQRPPANGLPLPLPAHQESLAALSLGALGVVYGDIGTSPLYAFKESIASAQSAVIGPEAVLGVLSMIFWAVTLVVSIKYMVVVLRADNRGEGGMLALLALVLRQFPARGRVTQAAIWLGLFGAAMFYGDSAITPAISVLSAVEGLEVVSPRFKVLVLPLTLAILIGLFAVQRHGTARVGSVFGPVMVVWFGVLGVLGALQIAREPSVLAALDPVHALGFVVSHPAVTLTVLAAVFLAVTGGEALYADMGHFGRRPMQLAWFWIVMPGLLLNYFGQGSLVLARPDAVQNPFFLLAPDWLQLPLVLLATAATVIASQAVISGAYSMTSQAIKLGYIPRMSVLFTSNTTAGQIYIPLVNWLLLRS